MLIPQNLNLESFPLLTLRNTFHETALFKKDLRIASSFMDQSSIFVKTRSHLNLVEHISKKKTGFFLEILLHGLNFNAKRIKYYRPAYFIDTHKSEIYILKETIVNDFKSRVHKRRLLFFSYNKVLLHNLCKKIKEFRPPNTYTGKGIFAREDIYFTKVGKIRNKK